MSKEQKQTKHRSGGQVKNFDSNIWDILKRHGQEYWSLRPFAEGKIRAIYFDGNTPKYGIGTPFTQKQIDDIERITQCSLDEIKSLRAFLSQNCNVNQFDDLTQRGFLRHIQRYSINGKQAIKDVKLSSPLGVKDCDIKAQQRRR